MLPLRKGYPSPDQRPKESDQLRGHSGWPCPWREQTSISVENHRWGAGGECLLHKSPLQPCGPLALHWSRVATSPELSRVPGAGQTVQPHFLLLDVLVTGLQSCEQEVMEAACVDGVHHVTDQVDLSPQMLNSSS